MEGAADFRPMAGDNTLDANGVDKGVNRNNLYYEADGSSFKNLQACTIEGLIYVDSFKAESERSEGTLAGISSLWGCEDNGGTVNFCCVLAMRVFLLTCYSLLLMTRNTSSIISSRKSSGIILP